MLVAQFSVEKVKQAVWECDGNKCLGPDVYNFQFVKAC